MHILITNDDGIHSPGLKELFEAVRHLGPVTIAAPSDEKSGASTSTTFTTPLKVTPHHWPNAFAYHINGTPADCTKIALGVLLKDNPPDIVISGINHGTNSGRNVLYSGTVGGVIESTLRGYPSIAFSYNDWSHHSFPDVKPHIPHIITHMVDHPLPHGTLLNVNFPNPPLKGIKLARQGLGYWLEDPEHQGDSSYLMKGLWADFDAEHPESDISYLRQNYITCSPLHVNELTDHTVMTSHKDHFETTLHKKLNLEE
ncbi:MAG: 5'-nucleotidase SurE [Chlamydiia bacterium]|nr:5'-nucleotidase SurE [Chlamydiia bacterium]MCH9616081.1 5'-nucleotidase SurE [Chlamydiia bacterium]MCH9629104.1 5'-nucleotidase SurE [Chlamydiia bacterium]